jgi:hypothetical protein
MQLKAKYKVDLWHFGYNYLSVYKKVWWWPFWFKVNYSIQNMHSSVKEAEDWYISKLKEKPKPKSVPYYFDINQ